MTLDPDICKVRATCTKEAYTDFLQKSLVELRNAIRYHRDQKGDDRCWLDDKKLYESLPETVDIDHTLPSKKEFLGSCEKFYECRQGKTFANVDECYNFGEYRSLNVPNQNL